jgi:signal transduction histidine kinase/CheY-like chemotaxis protein
LEHPLRIEGRVNYVDSQWRLLWLQTKDEASYLQLSALGPPLVQGQRVLIEGTIVPSKGLEANRVKVTVLRPWEPASALNVGDRLCDFGLWQSRVVTVEAYVDLQQSINDDHLRLGLVVDHQPVVAWVRPDDPRALPHWVGKFIRLTGLYSARFDPTKTHLQIEIWTGRQSDVVVVGSIADARRFAIPRTPIDQLFRAPPDRDVLISGTVQADEPGVSVTLRDDTGQAIVHSVQFQQVHGGDEVEAVGRVAITGAHWSLDSALFRPVRRPPSPGGLAAPPPRVLRRVDEIRRLSAAEAAQGRPVEISGLVAWSIPGQPIFFLEDVSGGIQVRYAHGVMETPPRDKYLRIEGLTYDGGSTPAVDVRHYSDLGTMGPPPVREITFEQATSGDDDGELVDLRGFYEGSDFVSPYQRLHVTTPGGEFIALLVSPREFNATPGSLIRVRGVCKVNADQNGRINGVELGVPSLAEITVEQDAPADFYNLPVSAIKDLRRLSMARDLLRVHVFGTVLQAVPGRLVYAEEGGAGVLMLSRVATPLVPGDRIEAVGILGSEGVRAALRETVYRKLGSGPPPRPETLTDLARPSMALDSHLVRVRGTLIDYLDEGDRTRLSLQTGDTLYEALLDHAPGAEPLPATLGAWLEVTGLYRIDFDDNRQIRGFHLRLHAPEDVIMVRSAPFWTLARALIAAVVLLGGIAIVLVWVMLLHRRVQRQTEQIRDQLEQRVRLEAELQRALRLESLGVLAGGIAHDFNNLLTIVMSNASLALLDERVSALAGDRLRDVLGGAARARDLTQQLLTFAKGGMPLRSVVALPDIVRETTDFVLHGSSVRCDFEFADDLWNANVDKDQTAQVIQNLVLNALQATPEGGAIRVGLRNETIAAGFRAALPAGRYVRLTVRDFGAGIDAAVLPRIFEPYFSTKKTGSGMGLATVYSIVKRHDGHIEVESAPGEGATITVWLGAAAAGAVPPSSRPAAETDPMVPGEFARVLLMDDEESIRRVGAVVLQRMGFEAAVAADGEEAVRRFTEAREAGQPFDLVILDLTVPGAMGGKTAIELIRKIDPQVPAIVSSGYSNDPVMADFSRFGFQAMVLKPYEVLILATTIRQLLSKRV